MRPYSLSSSFHTATKTASTPYHSRSISLFFSRMEAVFAWCKGVKFSEVQKLTGSFEGTTIRTLRRLEELVRQITNAAIAIGDKELEVKFEEGSKLIKRDIVFCSSLYL
jgi:ATP-dependent RNA helicase DOB1